MTPILYLLAPCRKHHQEMREHTQENLALACRPGVGPSPILHHCPGRKSQEGRASGRVSLSGPSLLWNTHYRKLFEGGSTALQQFLQRWREFSTFLKAWHLFFFFFLICFTYLFLAALGLRCCTRAFSSCSERELLFVAVHSLLIAVTSLVVEHGL